MGLEILRPRATVREWMERVRRGVGFRGEGSGDLPMLAVRKRPPASLEATAQSNRRHLLYNVASLDTRTISYAA